MKGGGRRSSPPRGKGGGNGGNGGLNAGRTRSSSMSKGVADFDAQYAMLSEQARLAAREANVASQGGCSVLDFGTINEKIAAFKGATTIQTKEDEARVDAILKAKVQSLHKFDNKDSKLADVDAMDQEMVPPQISYGAQVEVDTMKRAKELTDAYLGAKVRALIEQGHKFDDLLEVVSMEQATPHPSSFPPTLELLSSNSAQHLGVSSLANLMGEQSVHKVSLSAKEGADFMEQDDGHAMSDETPAKQGNESSETSDFSMQILSDDVACRVSPRPVKIGEELRVSPRPVKIGEDSMRMSGELVDEVMADSLHLHAAEISSEVCTPGARQNDVDSFSMGKPKAAVSNSLKQIFGDSTLAHNPPSRQFSQGNSVDQMSKEYRAKEGFSQRHLPHGQQSNSANLNVGGGRNVVPNVWERRTPQQLVPLELYVDLSNEEDIVKMDKLAMQPNILKLQGGLVGKIMGNSINAKFLNEELHKRWSLWGEFQLTMVSSGCFFCSFKTTVARDQVLNGGPYFIAGQLIGLDKWTPSFNPDSMHGFSAPTWIRLPKLPLVFWEPTSLGRIGSKFGVPLWVDEVTLKWERAEYARICVRIDFSKPLRNGVWLEGLDGNFFQPIAYEGISNLCFKCGCVGHKENECSLVNQTSRSPNSIGVQVSNANEEVQNPPTNSVLKRDAMNVDGRKVDSHGKEQLKPPMRDVSLKKCSNGIYPPPDQLDKGMGDWVLVDRRRRRTPPQVQSRAPKQFFGGRNVGWRPRLGQQTTFSFGSGRENASPQQRRPSPVNKCRILGVEWLEFLLRKCRILHSLWPRTWLLLPHCCRRL